MPRPRKLLLASQPLDGGVSRHVVELAQALLDEGFDVAVACPRSSLTWATLDGSDVELHPIQGHRGPSPGDARSLMALWQAAEAADAMHVHSAKAGFLGRLAAVMRRKSTACVFTPHGWSWWAAKGAEARAYLQLERLAAHWCRAIVALSTDERAAGLEARVGRRQQYHVIPNGVQLERFELTRAPIRGRILMVGRLARQKRPDVALRAFATARMQIPEAELFVVGDGPQRGGSEQLAASLGIEGAVHFLGNRDDIPALLAQSECALLASDYEGSPLAVLEAMAASVPVAATAAGGTVDLVEAGRTGALADKGDARGLAAALVHVLEDPMRAARLGAEGRRKVEADYSHSRMVHRLVSLYEGLLDR